MREMDTDDQTTFQLINRVRAPVVTYDWAFMKDVASSVGPLAVAVHVAITYLVYQGEDPTAKAIADLLGCSVPKVREQLARLEQAGALATLS